MPTNKIGAEEQQNSSEFSSAVKTFRKGKGWSQTELSRQSHVAVRTIVDIERGRPTRWRMDVVVRLAKALEQDPSVFLRLAGHGKVPDEKIQKIVKESGGFRFFGEIDPREFFQSIEKRIKPNEPVLICVTYPSAPGTIHRTDVQRILVDLFNRGLWVAMVLPYPHIEPIENAKRTSLARHYHDVYNQVVELAKELRSRVSSDKRAQLAVFVPRQGDRVQYVMPLAGLTEYRPTLIKYFSKDEHSEPNYELAAWVTLMQEKRDRWIRIYPSDSESEGETRYQKFLCWRDYFGDILSNCNPKKQKGWKQKDFQKTDWDLINLESTQ
jgi:transcriptional regulator with XRE-family HTH domain